MIGLIFAFLLSLCGTVLGLTGSEVCTRWNSDYPEQASTVWTAGSGSCSTGTLSQTAHDDAMRRTNLFRWLLGLESASVSTTNAAKCMECSLIDGTAETLTHTVVSTWDCFSADGQQACGSSNLAAGYGSPASSVNGYLIDSSVPSLGHRRWVICPRLDDVGFGHYTCSCQYTHWGCMWVFGSASGRTNIDLKFPAETWPVQALRGEWSFASTESLAGATLSVKRGGTTVASTYTALSGNYCPGYNWIKWSISESSQGGYDYDVKIVAGGNTWEYTVSMVDCDSSPTPQPNVPPPPSPTPKPTPPPVPSGPSTTPPQTATTPLPSGTTVTPPSPPTPPTPAAAPTSTVTQQPPTPAATEVTDEVDDPISTQTNTAGSITPITAGVSVLLSTSALCALALL